MSSVQVNFEKQDVSTKVPEAVKFKSKLNGVGGLIQGRETLRFDPTNQSAYSLSTSGGAGTCSIRLACDNMLDLSTATLNYFARGTQTAAVTGGTTTISADDSGLCWWKQASLWVNGVLVESISDVGLAQNILNKGTMPADYQTGAGVLAEGVWRQGTATVERSKWATGATAGNQSVINAYSIPLSVFGMTKLKSYFPSRFVGDIRIDLVFENSLNACMVDGTALAAQLSTYKVDFTDVNITCDAVYMAQQYYSMLADVLSSGAGWSCSVPTLNLITTTAPIAKGTSTFTLSEAREDILSLWVVQRPQADVSNGLKYSKSDFFANAFEQAQLILRGKPRPVQPITGFTQAYTEFRKSVGTFNSPVGCSAIGPNNWIQVAPYDVGTAARSFILGFNLESVLSDDLEVGNGISTRESAGSIQLKLTNDITVITEIVCASLYHALLKFQSGAVQIVS